MRFITEMLKARHRRQAARELRALPAEVLLDIGIEPHQIDAAVASMPAENPALHSRTRHAMTAALNARTAQFAYGAWPYTWRR